MKLFRKFREPKSQRIIGISIISLNQTPHPSQIPVGSLYTDSYGNEWRVTSHKHEAPTKIHPNFQNQYGYSVPYIEIWGYLNKGTHLGKE